MLDTCFFFLVSDYIMADGSLANALKRMRRGASAVVVGNFQIAREDALAWLHDKLRPGENVLALPPRELMRWALNHLHPLSIPVPSERTRPPLAGCNCHIVVRHRANSAEASVDLDLSCH